MSNIIYLKNHQKTGFNGADIQADFPILQQKINNKPLVYLDNGGTTQKPMMVIDALQNYYCMSNANVHRGVHTLSGRASWIYENARETVRKFINAQHAHEIVFVRGTTEAINLVAQSYGRSQLKSGDEVIISAMEHHSNIVPWHILAEQIGIKLRVIPITDSGEIELAEYQKLLNSRTKLVSIVHVSNVLGTINPIKEMIKIAHAQGVPVLIDGAQAISHMPVDVADLDCDFYAFSGHKMYGPTGIGVLYGKAELLNQMSPYQGGGGMISEVCFEKTEYLAAPEKFEAGTPHIAGAVGLATAIDYLNQIGMATIANYEHELLQYATAALNTIPGLRIFGNAANKAAVIAFLLDDIHPHDIGTILDNEGVAIRAGHHCAMPLAERLGVGATARASFGIYNTKADVDVLVQALVKVKQVFK